MQGEEHDKMKATGKLRGPRDLRTNPFCCISVRREEVMSDDLRCRFRQFGQGYLLLVIR